jgi:hypothetical protein
MASALSYSSFVPSFRSVKNRLFIAGYLSEHESGGSESRFQNLRFAQSVCGAQKLGE